MQLPLTNLLLENGNLRQKDENFVAFPVSPYSIVLWVKPYVCVQEEKRSSYFFNIYSHEADD